MKKKTLVIGAIAASNGACRRMGAGAVGRPRTDGFGPPFMRGKGPTGWALA